MNRMVTAESVTVGHPDKLCDLIADSVLDDCLSRDPFSRVGCEVIAAGSRIIVAGEVNSLHEPDVGAIVSSVLRRTGGFLDALQHLPEDRHVLVASHGAALNALYLQIKGLPLSLFWTHRFGNCSIVRLGLSGGRLSVLEEYPEPVAPA